MAKPLFDPTAVPFTSVTGEAAIEPQLLLPQFLRERLLSLGYASMQLSKPSPLQDEVVLKVAAVLMPIVMRDSGLTMLLTQRTAHLNDHAGQISFPGGRVEAIDVSPADTALRETEEEIGLHRRHIEIVGQLPDYFTVTGFRVMPVIGLVEPDFDLQLDAFEVAEVFEVPLAFLMNPANHQHRSLQSETQTRAFYAIPYQHYFIWGATAAMLRNLYAVLAGQPALHRDA